MCRQAVDKEKKIFTEEEKILAYEKQGIDIIVIYPIASGILDMTPEDFVKDILVDKLGAKKIVCGENFRFGKNRSGDTGILKILGDEYGYDTEIVPLLSINGNIISSTVIRKLINEGNIKKAEEMLGHKYIIAGRVVHGNAIGRTINTPTANIIPAENKLLPPNGVYISICNIDGIYYKGVTNIGYKPTIDKGEKQLGVETYFLDFEGDLYGKVLEIQLIRYLRPEKKFGGLKELKMQLQDDKDKCKNTGVDF